MHLFTKEMYLFTKEMHLSTKEMHLFHGKLSILCGILKVSAGMRPGRRGSGRRRPARHSQLMTYFCIFAPHLLPCAGNKFILCLLFLTYTLFFLLSASSR
jgi:hypothetical protein